MSAHARPSITTWEIYYGKTITFTAKTPGPQVTCKVCGYTGPSQNLTGAHCAVPITRRPACKSTNLQWLEIT